MKQTVPAFSPLFSSFLVLTIISKTVLTNTVELALYLTSTMCPEEIEREGLVEVVHERRFNRGPRPGLTSKAIMGGPAGRQQDNAWIPPVRFPTRGEKMRMIGCMVRHATELVMKNHFYTGK